MQADALATVMMVMPPVEAMALAERLRLRALLILHQHDGPDGGRYEVRRSRAWPDR
jgi:thiamine biosynthesis lipoprotein ApbE